MAGSRRENYKPPTKPWDPLNTNNWQAGSVPLKKDPGVSVSVHFLLTTDDAVGIDLATGKFYRRTGDGTYEEIDGGAHAARRRIQHMRRRMRNEGEHVEELAKQTRTIRNNLIELRARNAQSLWARDVRLGLRRIMERLGNVKPGGSKAEAQEWLELIVQPEHPDSIWFRFGEDTLGRINSGARQAEASAVARRLDERGVELTRMDRSLSVQELAIAAIIEELEENIARALRQIDVLMHLAMANGLVTDGERTPHYYLNELHWIVERLSIPPYNRAQARLMHEITDIRNLIENDSGQYRLEEVDPGEWIEVAGIAYKMGMSFRLLKLRGPLERLKLRLAEAHETGSLDPVYVKQFNEIRAELLTINDESFDRPVKIQLLRGLTRVQAGIAQKSFDTAAEALTECFDARLI